MMYAKKWLNICLCIFLTFCLTTSVTALGLSQYPELTKIAKNLVSQDLYTSNEIDQLFSSVILHPEIIQAFKRPAEKLSWKKYRGLFISDKIIRSGVKFWIDHKAVLARAAKTFGVREEIIVAILGVETRFGKIKGKYPIINSLSTLSLLYERRKSFFQSELESYLKLAKMEGLDPLTTLGSYAGAMGIPQFIASSYLAYAVDFDGNGRRDIINSYTDAIGSVGNYFQEHGWVSGMPVNAEFKKINPKRITQYKQTGKTPQHTLAEIKQAGFEIDGSYPDHLGADIIELDGIKGRQYMLVFDNFYVIKRYNQSNLYAMAVAELSEAIKSKREL